MHRKSVQRPYKLTVGALEENQMYCTVYSYTLVEQQILVLKEKNVPGKFPVDIKCGRRENKIWVWQKSDLSPKKLKWEIKLGHQEL